MISNSIYSEWTVIFPFFFYPYGHYYKVLLFRKSLFCKVVIPKGHILNFRKVIIPKFEI